MAGTTINRTCSTNSIIAWFPARESNPNLKIQNLASYHLTSWEWLWPLESNQDLLIQSQPSYH